MIECRRNICIFVVALLLLLTTYKYVAYGEAYTFETNRSTETVAITTEHEVSQNIIIDKRAKWKNDSYSISFAPLADAINGVIEFELWQNEVKLQSYQIMLSEICNQQENGFYALTQFDYSKLDAGTATIIIKGVALDKEVYIYIVDNTYNLPNCTCDANDVGKTLVQKYYFYWNNYEYYGRLAFYAVFVLSILVSFYIIFTKTEDKRVCNFIQIMLLAGHIAISYIYFSMHFLEPTWAEACTNFMHNALNKSFLENLFISDAGYLPLFQRLISLIIIKVLRIKAYYALYIMQLLAYIISGYLLAFFVKIQFKSYMSLKYRYILSLVFIMQMSDGGTVAFINFINYGIILILLYFLVDSYEWSKWEFIGICIFSSLACMSKGQYVIIFPFMVLCFIIFRASFGKRDRIFMGSCFIGSFVQFIYYFFSPYGGGWISDSGQSDYIKLLFECLRDIPMSFFAILGANITAINGAAMLIVIAFWGFTIWFFTKNVLKKWIKKETVDIDTRNICIMFVFLGAQCLFFKLTKAGIISEFETATDEFWNFYVKNVSWRYELFGYIPVLLIGIISIHILIQQNKKNIENAALIIFFGSIMIANPRLQLKGIGTDFYSTFRDYKTTQTTEYCLLKDIEKANCRIVPIMPGIWTYRKNADLYLIGDNIFELPDIIHLLNEEDVTKGKAYLSDYLLLDRDAGLWQVFIAKKNLVNCNKYKIILKDENGNIINQAEQDNTEYQKLVSFTFEDAVYNVYEIEVLDSENNNINIENALYVVTGISDRLDKKLIFGVDEFNNPVDIQNFILEQDFVALTDKLSMMQIFFGTYNRENKGIVYVELCDEDGNVIEQNSIDATTVKDNRWKDIEFNNADLELLKKYTIRIYSNDFSGDNNIVVWTNNMNSSGLPAAKVNGIPQDYALGIKLYGEDAHLERILNYSKIDNYVNIQNSTFQQSFIASKEMIDAIRLCFRTKNRKNEGIIHVGICDEFGNIVQESEIDASKLKDNHWETVWFHECRVAAGKRYNIRIYSNDFSDDNNVAIYVETLNTLNVDAAGRNDINEIFGAERDGVAQNYVLGVELYEKR